MSSSLPASLRALIQEREEFERKTAKEAPKDWVDKYFEERVQAETKFLREKQTEFSKLTAAKGNATSGGSGSSSSSLVASVQSIMNDVFKTLKQEFSTTTSYESADILAAARTTIVATTLKFQEDENFQTIKTVLNEVFKEFRKEFEDEKSYTGSIILDKMKTVIVSTTNNLVQSSPATDTPAPAASKPASQQTSSPAASKPAPAAATSATKPSSSPQLSKISAEPSVSPSAIAASANANANSSSTPSFLRNLKTKSAESAASASPAPSSPPPEPSSPPSESSAASPAASLTSSPSTKAKAAMPGSPTQARASEAGEDRKVVSGGGAGKGGVESIRSDAEKRINKTPGSKEVDITDPEILNAYVRIRNPADSLLWMVLTYEGQYKLKVSATGEGGFEEFLEEIDEDKPAYMYINYRFGDTERNKNVFLTFVPDAMSFIAKARVIEHKAKVEAFFKYMHITWHCSSAEELSEKELNRMLLKAGGANYSVQEENKGNFKDYKTVTHEFYKVKDSETKLDKVIYAEGPLTTTPCDISGRSMVASQSEFIKNTSEFFKTGK